MEHKFRDILEHDMDMLILEEFACSSKFAKIFLNKVGIDNANVISTWQSKTDNELGESDMMVVFDCVGKKIALLIEDKIDAIAMPEQPSRYSLRGDKGIQDGDYDNYYVFIVAPRQYLDINEKAKEYPNRVSYEELKEYFEELDDTRSSFKLAQLNLAIEKQKNGYQAVKNSLVTDFWNKYIEYKNTFFPKLNLVISSNIKPTNGIRTYFKTNNKNLLIYHKTNKGYVDLTINGQANKFDDIKRFLISMVGNYYEHGFNVVKTGKSCAIRICVPIVAFTGSFDEQKPSVEQAFLAVEKLYELSIKLEIAGIYDVLK